MDQYSNIESTFMKSTNEDRMALIFLQGKKS